LNVVGKIREMESDPWTGYETDFYLYWGRGKTFREPLYISLELLRFLLQLNFPTSPSSHLPIQFRRMSVV
jgi:hypothetical protein